MQYPMKRTMLIACLAIASVAFAAKKITPEAEVKATTTIIAPTPSPAPPPAAVVLADVNSTSALYNSLQLEAAGLNQTIFEKAMQGFTKLCNAGKILTTNKITIVDFSQPSSQKRLYVIDLETKKILFHSLVSHGRNTGGLWAKSFSNQPESFKSSPGFYVTAETYNGGNGYSLRLDGLEKNINDNARSRAIVMHGAPYANESSINALGFLGRSQGCPALPQSLHKPVINTIKNGTCLFIYTPDESYVKQSFLLSTSA